MRNLTFACLLILVGANLPVGADDSKHESGNEVILDNTYKMFAPGGDDEIGTSSISAIKDKQGKINITESLAVDFRGRKAGYKSTVIYTGESPIVPESASTETNLSGKKCMTGKITLSEKTYSFEGVGFLQRNGEAIEPPRSFGAKTSPSRTGHCCFSLRCQLLGPRFCPNQVN